MKRRLIMTTAAMGIVTAGAAGAYMTGTRDAWREDCPGKILCPITGDLICADKCPAETAQTVSPSASEVPACCAAGN